MGTDKDKKLHEELNAINVNGSQNTIGDHNFIIQSSDVHLHLKDPNHKIFFILLHNQIFILMTNL